MHHGKGGSLSAFQNTHLSNQQHIAQTAVSIEKNYQHDDNVTK